MKKVRQWLSMFLVVIMLTGVFPAGATVYSDVPETEVPSSSVSQTAEPLGTIKNSMHGTDFAAGELANRLETIFYSGISSCVTPSMPAIGGALNNSTVYTVTFANESGSYSAYQCVAYAIAAYSYLFGYKNDCRVVFDDASARSSLSAALFDSYGVRCGAYLRTTNNSDGTWNGSVGHSMIILSYDSSGVYILEGNSDGAGGIDIVYYTWSQFNSQQFAKSSGQRYVCVLSQPIDSVYDALGDTQTTTPSNPIGKHGSDYASGELANRLETIFYSGISGCVTPSIPAVGGTLDNNTAYTTTYANHSGSSTDYQCQAYARAAYSYLFGHNLGVASTRDSFNDATARNSLSYELFSNYGIRCGAYLRTTNYSDGTYNPSVGHSILILSYDSEGITTLEGNWNGAGGIAILEYTWSEFNRSAFTNKGRYVCSLSQPFASVYEELGDVPYIASGTCGDNLTWTLSNDGVLTISGTGNMTDYDGALNIPWYTCREQIKQLVIGNGATSISASAFDCCTNLKSATIGNGVTAIGDWAFYNCTALESIALPDSLTNLGAYVFYNCANLKRVTLGNGVTSLGDRVFSNCASLESIVIPDSVQSIGPSVFAACAKLSSVTIGSGVTAIGDWAFYDCDALGSIVIPDSVTSIGAYTFYYCDGLTNITIGSGLTSIGLHALFGCGNLTDISVDSNNLCFSSANGILYNKNKTVLVQYPRGKADTSYTIPGSVTSIGDFALHGCFNLISITLPDSVTDIGADGISYCTSLTSIVVPNSVTKLGDHAFYHCEGLVSVTLGSSITNIEEYAFDGCNVLATVNYLGTENQWNAITIGENNDPLHNANIIFAKVNLAAPTVTVRNLDSGEPRLSWGAVDGAAKYEVWRATSANGTYSKIYTTKYVNYTDSTAESGETYYYKVRAINGDAVGEYSAVISCQCLGGLEAPIVTVRNLESGEPRLSWSAVDGAAKYEIWRADSANGSYSKIYTTKYVNYTDSTAVPGKTYFYKVRAIDGENVGEFSAVVTITVPVDLGTPTVTASNNTTTGKIVVKWNEVAGADKYEVYRSTSKNGTYTKVLTTTGLKMNHNSANAGETFYYKVRAVSGDVKSAFSAPVGRTCDLAQPVATATNDSTTGKIILTWAAVAGADKYEVYRSTSKDGTYTKVLTTTGLKMNHNSANAGETFYYKVKAICTANSSGNSTFSVAVGRTCDCAKPVVTIKLKDGAPRLSWSAVDGAVKYEILRSTRKNGTYTKIYTTKYVNYTDSGAKSGTTYYYKVRAICSVSAGNSAYSEIKFVTAK